MALSYLRTSNDWRTGELNGKWGESEVEKRKPGEREGEG